MTFKWRKWNNIIHRDLGYLMVGLTIIYAVSGFILNHKHDWNPNYSIQKETVSFKPLTESEYSTEAIKGILTEIKVSPEYKSLFRPDPKHVQVFYQKKTVNLDLSTGTGYVERIKARKVIREMNQLHLNMPGSLWTYVADFYAIALLLLGLTGLFVLKGKNGIKGRGAWFTVAGVVIPIILMIIYAA